MTIKEKVIAKLYKEDKLKKYNTINFDFGNFYLRHDKSNIVKENEVPTLITSCEIYVVVEE